ncbi:hypothetical protein V8F33_003044 [Rhypophila sp. PSN 637]
MTASNQNWSCTTPRVSVPYCSVHTSLSLSSAPATKLCFLRLISSFPFTLFNFFLFFNLEPSRSCNALDRSLDDKLSCVREARSSGQRKHGQVSPLLTPPVLEKRAFQAFSHGLIGPCTCNCIPLWSPLSAENSSPPGHPPLERMLHTALLSTFALPVPHSTQHTQHPAPAPAPQRRSHLSRVVGPLPLYTLLPRPSPSNSSLFIQSTFPAHPHSSLPAESFRTCSSSKLSTCNTFHDRLRTRLSLSSKRISSFAAAAAQIRPCAASRIFSTQP